MATLNLTGLSPMARGRLDIALQKRARYDGAVRTLAEHIATLKGEKTQGDGGIDYDRRRFNRMNEREQAAYTARLAARRYYYVDGWQVPKIVWDAVESRS